MQSDFHSGSGSGLHSELEILFEEAVDLANYLKRKARHTHRGEQLSASGRILLQSLQLHGQQTVPALAHIRSTSRQNIQVLADRLEAAGYIRFISNPGHKRSDYVALTDAGRDLLTAANQREANLLAQLSLNTGEAEVKAAAELLRKLRLQLGGERKRRKSNRANEKGDGEMVASKTQRPPAAEPAEEEALPVSLL